MLIVGFAALWRLVPPNWSRLEGKVPERDAKINLLPEHHGVPPPSGLSLQVEQLAGAPKTKIAAIKQYRKENPGVGLAQAKAAIEEFARRRGTII